MSAKSKDWLAEKHLLLKIGQSIADLNLQESVWGWMSNCLAGQIFETMDEFKDAVRRQWDLITDKYLQSLYRSLPKRYAAVIALGGAMTRY